MVQIDPFSALSKIGQASQDRASIAENFEAFLTLLTTQLRHQSPLDPLDTNEFTQQLVQFTGVEQQVKMNANLETLAQISAASAINGAVGYIGLEVTASGAKAELSQGSAAWEFKLPASSDKVTFTITDAAGNIVSTETRDAPEGDNLYVWHGENNDGGQAPEGVYTLEIRAEGSGGSQLQVEMGVTGRVDGVDMSGSEPVLQVQGRVVRLSEITAIKLPSQG